MRKQQKQLAMEFAKTLSQAHKEVKTCIEKGDFDQALELLEQCQQGAIRLGTMIEGSEGEDFVTVGLLEEYCEQVFQIHQELASGAVLNGAQVYKTLYEWMVPIEKSIRDDIKARIEAVFLPYKASMWDALESVWRAADADPNCDAYVIPIPYYDKNSDGRFRELHYEGDQYPKDVPVVSYESYDFRQRRPDLIFIHNPYDEANLVTSVHPSFYAKNLKQYTEQLVYIPYFVLGEINPKDEAAVKGIQHFIGVPGVYHADKVIVQSENMKKIYVKVLTQLNGKETRKIWEQKILGLGSPKLDKVHSTRKEDLEIPETWRKIMQREDGSFKKIILYNTSVTALLQHNEKMLEKMKDVFRVFYENREEVALLWRPHPLIHATVSSMRPQLWPEYQALLEEYRGAGWGIYDDTADLDRAIAISDGYYGDPSSLVTMYRETGKPVMVQRIPEEVEEKENAGEREML